MCVIYHDINASFSFLYDFGCSCLLSVWHCDDHMQLMCATWQHFSSWYLGSTWVTSADNILQWNCVWEIWWLGFHVRLHTDLDVNQGWTRICDPVIEIKPDIHYPVKSKSGQSWWFCGFSQLSVSVVLQSLWQSVSDCWVTISNQPDMWPTSLTTVLLSYDKNVALAPR